MDVYCGGASAAAILAQNAAANVGGGEDRISGGLLSNFLRKLVQRNSWGTFQAVLAHWVK